MKETFLYLYNKCFKAVKSSLHFQGPFYQTGMIIFTFFSLVSTLKVDK